VLFREDGLTRVSIAAMAFLLSATLASAAGGDRCKVTDPTGTPLNVRDAPTARGTIVNGVLVSVIEYTDDVNGKPWVRVKDYKTQKPIGWVFRKFVSCF
jgi:Bacterial SH3 domain